MWFIGVEVEQEKSAPPPKKNPGSAPEKRIDRIFIELLYFPYIFKIGKISPVTGKNKQRN